MAAWSIGVAFVGGGVSCGASQGYAILVSMVERPTGTVTFLFTDIEGSTRLWEEQRPAMETALEHHDEILRSAIESHGGYVFSTAGDAFAAAFSRAGQAVAAARTAQELLGSESWPTTTPIRVRMGVHTGEAQERSGDYFGPAVNRAARIMGAGHGGQVLVSETTVGVVGGGVGPRLGEFALRGFAEPVGIYQLGDGEFSPLRVTTLGVVGNLPRPVSDLVGRTREVAELVAAARRVGLVTVVGPGGMGKTRLAIEAAAELAADTSDGGWFVDLATATDPDTVIHVVIDSLGVPVGDGEDLIGAMVRHLASRTAVVVLDNCEHVLAGAAQVAEAVIAGAPGTRLVATSRERLDVAGEQVWPLGGLSASGGGVELFVARARAVDPHFEIDDPGVVAELCEHLDGMPLAIELAAARVGSMTPAELLGHLGDRFRLLRVSRRGQARGHRGARALRETVDWSYGLLDQDQQSLLVNLSVFASSFTADDAVAVSSDDRLDRFDVIDVVGELADKSLLLADRSGEVTRFRMLETIRAFGHERLTEAGTRDIIGRAHAIHVASWLAGVLEALKGPDDLAAVSELDRGWPELREALRWSLAALDVDVAVELVAGLGTEAQMRDRREAREWLWAVVGLDGVLDHPRAAELLAAASIVDWIAGRFDDGLRRWEQVEAIRSARDDPITLQVAAASSLHHTMRAELDRSLETMAVLRREAASTDDAFSEAHLLMTMAMAQCYGGDGVEAQALLDELRQQASRLGNGYLDTCTAFVETVVLLDTDPAASVASARRTLELAERASMPWIANTVSNYLTYGLIRSGQHREALERILAVLDEISAGAALSSLLNTVRNTTVLLAYFGRDEPAATTAGWLRAQISGIPGTPAMRHDTDLTIGSLRDRLGSEAFDAAADRAAHGSQQDIIALARSELQSLARSLDPQ